MNLNSNLYQMIFEQSPEAIILLDQKVILDCTLKTGELFQQPKEDLVAQPWSILFPVKQAEGLESIRQFQTILENSVRGQAQDFTWLCQRKDRKSFQTQIKLQQITLADQILFQAVIQEAFVPEIEQAYHLGLLNEISKDLTKTTTVEEALKALATTLKRATKADQIEVILFDKPKERWFILTFDGQEAYFSQDTKTFSDEESGKTALRQVMLTQETMIIPDLSLSTYQDLQDLAQQKYASIIITPLVASEKAMGVLRVISHQLHAYSTRDEYWFVQIASQLATTIENRALLRQMEQALAETEFLYKAGRRLNTANTYQDIIMALAEAKSTSFFNQITLMSFEYDETDELEALVTVAMWQQNENIASSSRYLRKEFTSIDRLLSLKPIIIEDVETTSFLDANLKRGLLALNVRSSVVLPLWGGGRQWGVLTLDATEPHQITDQQIQPYVSLAAQIAVTIENLRLFDQVQQRAVEQPWAEEDIAAVEAIVEQAGIALENQGLFDQTQAALAQTEAQARRLVLLNELAAEFNLCQNLDEIFRTAIIKTHLIVGGDLTRVALLTPDKNYVEVFAVDETGLASRDYLALNKGDSLSQAMHEKRIVVISDMRKELDHLNNHFFYDLGIEATMTAPLIVGEDVIGTLNVGSQTADIYTESEVTLMRQIVSLLATIIENQRRFDQTQTALSRMEALYQASQTISHLGNLQKIWQDLAEVLVNQLGHTSAWLALRDDDPQILQGLAGAGFGVTDEVINQQIPLDPQMRNPAISALLTRQPLMINDISQDERAADLPDEMRQILGRTIHVPIVLRDEALGIIAINRPLTKPEFVEQDIEFLVAVAEQAVVGLQNVRLFEQTSTSLARTEILYQITQASLSSERLLDIFQIIVDKTATALTADQVAIFTLNLETQDVTNFVSNQRDWFPQLGLGENLFTELSQGLAGQAWREFKPILSSKTGLDPDKNPERQQSKGELGGAMMVAPIHYRDEVLGILNVVNQSNKPDFTSEDLDFLMTLANQVAIAINRQFLLDQLQTRAAELEETGAFLSSIIENIPTMVFVKEAETLCFIRFNQAWENLLGLSRSDMIGKNDYDFFPKEEADFFTAKDREVLASGKLLDIPEEPVQTPTGETRLFHTRKVPILGLDGKPRYLLGISEDITEQQAAEAEREQLLVEVQEAYRQYLRQEWHELLTQEDQDNWRIEYQQPDQTIPTTDQLKQVQDEVLTKNQWKTVSWSDDAETKLPLEADLAEMVDVMPRRSKDHQSAPNGKEEGTALITPITLRGETIGTFSLQDTIPDRQWTSDEINLVEAVSEQLALTLENLRLYNNTQQRAAREHVTRQVTEKIRNAGDTEAILQTTVNELLRVMGVDEVFIDLNVPRSDSDEEQ